MKTVTIPQGTIQYREIGNPDGPVLVFVHGFLVDSELWSGVADELLTTHRCILPTWPLGSHKIPMNADADLTPSGLAAVVANVLDALDLRDVTLVGNNSGGAISQLVAADHPERIARVVLTNCDLLDVFPPPEFQYLKWVPRIPGAMWMIAKSMLHLGFLRQLPMAYGAVTNKRIDDAQLRRWVEPAARMPGVRRDASKFMSEAGPHVTLGVANRLENFEGELVFVWSKDDHFFPIKLARQLAARVPNGHVVAVDGASVFLPLDDPKRVAAEIKECVRLASPRNRPASPRTSDDERGNGPPRMTP